MLAGDAVGAARRGGEKDHAAQLLQLQAPQLSGQPNGGAVTLSWTHSGGADGFLVGRGVRLSGVWRYSAVAVLDAGARSFVDQPTAAGEYTYVIVAYKSDDDVHMISDPSNNFDALIGQ